MRRTITAALSGVLVMASFSIRAETVSETVRAFGLVGTWSPDCAKEISKGGERTTYAVPEVGEPTIETTVGTPNDVVVVWRSTIQEAARTKDDKIKLITSLTETKVNGRPKNKLDRDFIPNVLTISKERARTKILDSRKIDNSQIYVEEGIEFKMIPKDIHQPFADPNNQQYVKGITETPFREKCGN